MKFVNYLYLSHCSDLLHLFALHPHPNLMAFPLVWRVRLCFFLSTSIILIMFPFFVHFCPSPCLAVPFLSPLLSLSNSLSLPALSKSCYLYVVSSSVLRSFCCAGIWNKGKMKAFVPKWLCIWCQSGSFFMTVQTVIRVGPYKELLPLMGLVWINYWRTHTSRVIWGRLSICAPWLRCVWVWFLRFASQ